MPGRFRKLNRVTPLPDHDRPRCYWRPHLIVVAVAHRRLGPNSSATTSTVERPLPSSAVHARCWSPTHDHSAASADESCLRIALKPPESVNAQSVQRSRKSSPTGLPLSWLLQQMRRLERPTRTRQPRPQPSSTSGCRSQSAVCCGNVGTQESRAERDSYVAIRSRVHNSPVNPFAVAQPAGPAPLFRAGHRTAWAPGRSAAADKVSIPRSFQRACQTPMAWAETSNWRATSVWRTPAANSSAARSRRAFKRSRCAAGRRGTVGMPAILTRRVAQQQLLPAPLNRARKFQRLTRE